MTFHCQSHRDHPQSKSLKSQIMGYIVAWFSHRTSPSHIWVSDQFHLLYGHTVFVRDFAVLIRRCNHAEYEANLLSCRWVEEIMEAWFGSHRLQRTNLRPHKSRSQSPGLDPRTLCPGEAAFRESYQQECCSRSAWAHRKVIALPCKQTILKHASDWNELVVFVADQNALLLNLEASGSCRLYLLHLLKSTSQNCNE